MHSFHPIWSFQLFGLTIDIKPETIVQFAIVLLIGVLVYFSTRNLQVRNVGKRQVIVESIYNMIQNVVDSNIGEKYRDITPFIGTLATFILVMNLMRLTGLPVPTKNLSVTISLGLIVFFFIQIYALKNIGIKHYFKGFLEPTAAMLPINILERVMLPVSLSLRLFGNILAATFLVELVYESLYGVNWFAQLILPIPLHAYFDIFDGVIQMVIFIMLTMINIKIVSEH